SASTASPATATRCSRRCSTCRWSCTCPARSTAASAWTRWRATWTSAPRCWSWRGCRRRRAWAASARPGPSAAVPRPSRPAVFAEQLSPKEVIYAGLDRRYKFIAQLVPKPQELLFDLAADPAETRDLASDPTRREAARGLIAEVQKFVQIGQAGYHVSLSSPHPEMRYSIHASTDATFGDVQRFSLVTGETLVLAPDRKQLDYDFEAGSATRHLVLRTDPPGADVQFTISLAGRLLDPGQIALGKDGHHPTALPFALQAAPLQVS